MPLRSRPLGSRAVYSNAPMPSALVLARDAQDFLHRRLAAQDLRAAVVANGRRQGARIALEVMLCGDVVDHGAHLVIDDDELVDAGASAVAVARIAPRPVQRGRRPLGADVEQ